MPPKTQIRLSIPVSYQTRLFSTSLTPFLYQTQTLEGHLWSAKSNNPLHRTHRAHRGFCSTSRKSAQSQGALKENAIHSENISNPISDAYSRNRFRPDGPAGRTGQDTKSLIPQNSTFALSEKAVFDQIDSELSLLTGNESTIGEMEMWVDVKENEEAAYEDITTIFENAIKDLKVREERSIKSILKNRAQYAKNPPLRAIDLSLHVGDIPWLTGEKMYNAKPSFPIRATPNVSEDTFRVERRMHEQKFRQELEHAQTDVAIWSVLETQVFSLIETVQRRNEEEASKRNNELPLKSAARKTPKRKQGHYKKEEIHPVPLAIEVRAPHSLSPTPPSLPSPATVPELRSLVGAVPPEVTLSIVQHNYGNYCLEALQLLRREFPASPYALKILPTIRRLGAISYVLGATSNLYNELLYIRWTQYTDMHGMADLLEEMRNKGVEQNEVTAAVVRAVRRERTAFLGEDNYRKGEDLGGKEWKIPQRRVATRPEDSATLAWWQLRGVHEAWDRLWRNYRAAAKRMEERRLREARDEQYMRAAEEEEKKEDEQG